MEALVCAVAFGVGVLFARLLWRDRRQTPLRKQARAHQERRALMVTMGENLDFMQKRLNTMTMMASSEGGVVGMFQRPEMGCRYGLFGPTLKAKKALTG